MAKTDTASKELAKPGDIAASDTPSNALAMRTSTEISADLADEMEGMDTGLENVTANNLIIPRITILQGLSPQINKLKPEYIPGAQAGQFCDVAMGDVFNELILLPCYFATVYLEWAPRATGKGLVANHGMDASVLARCKPDEKRRMFTPEGNLIAETMTFFCLNLTAGGRRSFLPLSSTALKDGRQWLTLITNQRVYNPKTGRDFMPPIFFRPWKVSITAKSNAEGDWFGYKFAPHENHTLELDPSKQLLEEAKAFHEQARSGLVTGDLSSYSEDLDRAQSDGAAGNGDNAKDITGDTSRAM